MTDIDPTYRTTSNEFSGERPTTVYGAVGDLITAYSDVMVLPVEPEAAENMIDVRLSKEDFIAYGISINVQPTFPVRIWNMLARAQIKGVNQLVYDQLQESDFVGNIYARAEQLDGLHSSGLITLVDSIQAKLDSGMIADTQIQQYLGKLGGISTYNFLRRYCNHLTESRL